MLNKSKLHAAGLLLAVFVAGLLVGGAGSAALAERDGDRRKRERPSYVERLDRELGLRAAQRDTIQVILDDYQQAMSGLWEDVKPQFTAIRMDIRARIMAALDSTQAAGYAAMIAKSDSARAARERGDSAR